jgi:hypothetical protein
LEKAASRKGHKIPYTYFKFTKFNIDDISISVKIADT